MVETVLLVRRMLRFMVWLNCDRDCAGFLRVSSRRDVKRYLLFMKIVYKVNRSKFAILGNYVENCCLYFLNFFLNTHFFISLFFLLTAPSS